MSERKHGDLIVMRVDTRGLTTPYWTEVCVVQEVENRAYCLSSCKCCSILGVLNNRVFVEKKKEVKE